MDAEQTAQALIATLEQRIRTLATENKELSITCSELSTENHQLSTLCVALRAEIVALTGRSPKTEYKGSANAS